MARRTVAEETYTAVHAVMQNGVNLAEAIRQVAEETGRKETAVRGNYYSWDRRINPRPEGTGRRRSPRQAQLTPQEKPASVDDLLANARRALEDAAALVDAEVNEARQALDAAQRRYDDLVASTADRKREIAKKLRALAA